MNGTLAPRLSYETARRGDMIMRIFITVLLLTLLFSAISSTAAYAAAEAVGQEQQIVNGIQNGVHKIYNILTAIILPITAVLFAWNAFKVLFGGTRGMEEAKRMMLTVLLVMALIWLAPVIVETVSGWFSSAGGTSNVWNQTFQDPTAG